MLGHEMTLLPNPALIFISTNRDDDALNVWCPHHNAPGRLNQGTARCVSDRRALDVRSRARHNFISAHEAELEGKRQHGAELCDSVAGNTSVTIAPGPYSTAPLPGLLAFVEQAKPATFSCPMAPNTRSTRSERSSRLVNGKPMTYMRPPRGVHGALLGCHSTTTRTKLSLCGLFATFDGPGAAYLGTLLRGY